MLKEKSCFMDLDESFYNNKGVGMGDEEEITEVLVRSMMSVHEGANTRVREDSEMSEEFEVKVRMHQGSVLSPLFLQL